MTRRMKTVAAAVAVLSVGVLAACKHQHGSHNLQELKEHVDVTMKKIGVSEEQRTNRGNHRPDHCRRQGAPRE